MAKAIHIYPIPMGPAEGLLTCALPKGSKVVRAEYAATQGEPGEIVGPNMKPLGAGETKLMLFVLFDPSADSREYTFKLVGDDCPVEDMEYCTSVFAPPAGFLHVFQSP